MFFIEINAYYSIWESPPLDCNPDQVKEDVF